MNTFSVLQTLTLIGGLAIAVVPFTARSVESAAPAVSAAPPAIPDSSPSPAPEWLSRVNAGEPGPFPLPRSFHASYQLTWSNIEAGRAEVDCTDSESTGQISTKITGGTIGMARTLYQVDGSHLSVADRRTLHPLHLDQTELESRKRKTARVDFTASEAQRSLLVVDRKDPSSSSATPRKRSFRFPGMFDMHSALFYIRSLPLNNGDTRTMIAMTAGNPYLVTVKVDRRESVKTIAGTYPAIECSINLSKINKRGDLEPHKAFKSARVWISDDSDRLIVKAEAQVFVGTVTLDLTKVTFPGK